MTTPIVAISNLECAYEGGSVVLHIDDLTIPRGKLIFVLGSSGVGKSTFLETIGLMNRTIHNSNAAQVLFSDRKGVEVDLTKLSTGGEKSDIANHRLQYYSFLFQNTNFMPSLSAGRNMCITQMLSGISFEEAKHKVLKLMDRLELDRSFFESSVNEVSGGQRQRIAFIRAISSPFEVLFGDEPTGNLDTVTASLAMTLLKKVLKETQSTGIIVSHDINLAVNFADVIVPIVSKSNSSISGTYGCTSNRLVLSKTEGQYWEQNGMPQEDINGLIQSYFTADS